MAKGGGGGGVRLPPGAYYALTVLTALNVVNLWHRYLVVSTAFSVSIYSGYKRIMFPTGGSLFVLSFT